MNKDCTESKQTNNIKNISLTDRMQIAGAATILAPHGDDLAELAVSLIERLRDEAGGLSMSDCFLISSSVSIASRSAAVHLGLDPDSLFGRELQRAGIDLVRRVYAACGLSSADILAFGERVDPDMTANEAEIVRMVALHEYTEDCE